MSVPQQGTESRSTILPSAQPSGIGFLGSPYSPADALPTPAQVGVTTGDSLSDVMNAVKGVAFYTDMIGFGQSSSPFTQGMAGLQPLGVNYFLNTGQACSNGATMYKYFQGVPSGNVLGNKVSQAMAQMGLPALRGLAPGMIEDAEDALNPSPMLNALFGSGYPQCKQVTLQVGDMQGNIQDSTTGQSWIESPETAVRGQDGLMYQTRWVQDTDSAGNPINLTKDQWTATPKAYNSDGTPITESFTNFTSNTKIMAAIGILCILLFGALSVKRK